MNDRHHAYVSRPDPSNALSEKRQRVSKRAGADDCFSHRIGVKLLGTLPTQVEAIPGLSDASKDSSGIATCNGDGYGWIVSPEGRHVYIWKLPRTGAGQKNVNVTRLILNKNPHTYRKGNSKLNNDIEWYLSLFDSSQHFGGKNVLGVMLVSSLGDVFCWPVATAETTPIVVDVLLTKYREPASRGSTDSDIGSSAYISIARHVPLHPYAMMLGTSDGRLILVSLSQHDYSINYEILANYEGENLAKKMLNSGAALVGRLLGFSGKTEEDTSAKSNASGVSSRTDIIDLTADRRCRIVRDLIIVMSDTNTSTSGSDAFFVFALYGDGMLRSWEVSSLQPDRQLRFCWEWKRLESEARSYCLEQSRESSFSESDLFIFDKVMWVGQKGKANSHTDRLVVAMRYYRSSTSEISLFLHEIKGISGDTPVPRIADSTNMRTFPHIKSDSFNYVQVEKVWDPSKTPGPTSSILVCRQDTTQDTELGNSNLLSLEIFGVEFPLADAKWSERSIINPSDFSSANSSRWFALEQCNGDVLLLTHSCSLRVWLEQNPDFSNQLADSSRISSTATQPSALQDMKENTPRSINDEKLTRAILPFNRSSKFRKISESEAEKILAQAFRTFCQAVAQGRDGITDMAHDEDWVSFQHSIGTKDLGAAVRYVIRLELDREATQRWAEKWATQNNYAEFAPKLVHRHLSVKSSRFFGKDGFISFLNKFDLIDRLPIDVRLELRGYAARLEACNALCNLHANFTSEESEVLLKAMKLVLVARRNCEDEEQLDKQLKVAGLSTPDVFYSQVTCVEQICQVIGNDLGDNHGDDFYVKCCAANAVLETIFLSALRVKNDADFGLKLKTLSVSYFDGSDLDWTEDEELLNVVENQIRLISFKLKEIHSATQTFSAAGAFTKVLILQLAKLGDILLGGLQQYANGRTTNQMHRDRYEAAKDLVMLPLLVTGENYFLNEGKGSESQFDGKQLAEESVSLVHGLAEKYVHHKVLIRICEMQRIFAGFEEGQQLLHKYVNVFSNSLIRVETVDSGSLETSIDGPMVVLRGSGDVFLSNTSAGLAAVECDQNISANEKFIVAENHLGDNPHSEDKRKQDSIPTWSLMSCSGLEPSSWLHHRDGKWEVVKLESASLPNDVGSIFRLVDVKIPKLNAIIRKGAGGANADGESGDETTFHHMFSVDGSVIGIDRSNNSIINIHNINEWKGMARSALEWYLENDNPYVITRLMESGELNGFLDREFEEFLNGHRHQYTLDSGKKNKDLVSHLEWMNRLRTGLGVRSARVLLESSRREQDSLSQRKTLLSIGKLALWAEKEAISEHLEVELDFVYDSQNILNDFGTEKQLDSVLSMNELVDVLLEGNSRSDSESKESKLGESTSSKKYAYCIGMLEREENRLRLEHDGDVSAIKPLTERLHELSVLRLRVWWDTLLQDFDTWSRAVRTYLKSGSSISIEETIASTKLISTARELITNCRREKETLISNEILQERFGLDRSSVEVMVHKVVANVENKPDNVENEPAWVNVIYKALSSL